MKKTVFKYLFNFLHGNNIIYEYQTGFLPGCSTTHHLVHLYHTICEALDKKQKSYLSHRTARCFAGCSSAWRNINAGVPQGSVLGSIIYLVYINDMKDGLQSSLSLFADDNLMHISTNSDETNKNILNSDLGIMKAWADQWLIKFSVEKTKSMFVRYQDNTDDKLIFNNHDLDNVSEYKHLGDYSTLSQMEQPYRLYM